MVKAPLFPAFLFPFLLLTACYSPSASKNDTTRTLAAEASDWARAYKDALRALPSPQACATLDGLAERQTPISAVARERYLANCRSDEAALNELDSLAQNSALLWLRPQLLEDLIRIAEARSPRHFPTLAKYGLSRSKSLSSQTEKEALLQASLEAARITGEAEKAKEIETELFRVSPRLRPNPDSSLWMKVADDLRTNEKWNEAFSYYEQINAGTTFTVTEIRKALDGIRQGHKSLYRFYGGPLENFLTASKRTATFAEQKLKTDKRLPFDERRALAEAWMQYARDEWSYGSADKAREEVARFLSTKGLENIFYAYGWWLRGRIEANYGVWDKAANYGARATTILSKEKGRGWTTWHYTLWDDAFWAAALAQRKTGEREKSVQTLATALSRTQTSQSKFLFWSGIGLKESGKTTEARAQWEKLVENDPYNFYGMVGARELGKSFGPLPDMDLENVTRPGSVSPADFEILTWLSSADEYHLAQGYSRKLLGLNGTDLPELRLRAFVRDFATISDIFFAASPSLRNQLLSRYARLFYPAPFADLVDAAVARNPRVERAYVYSIMRQESGFEPVTRSWANAYGLLQLLPRVAREVQEKAGVTFTYDYELFRPEINIPLGVAHMDDIYALADGSFIVRSGAYNGTLEKVLEWKERLFTGNVYEFVEEIPFEETRTYVRLILRNYLMNRRLDAREAFAFPEELLRL